MRPNRFGLSLTETLVAIGIVGVLMAILIPAVQSARETARRATCQNNLRQSTLAIQDHEATRGGLPDLYYGTFLERPRTAIDEF